MSNAMYYSVGFNLSVVHAATPLGTLTVKQSGKPDLVVNIWELFANDYDSVASQFFWHSSFFTGLFVTAGNDPARSIRYPHYALQGLATAMRNKLTALATAAGWAVDTNFGFEFREQLGSGVAKPHHFLGTQNGLSVSYQFSTAAGAALFGAAGTSLIGAAVSHEFPNVPQFVVFPTVQTCGATDAENAAVDYEPTGIATFALADDCTGYGNSRLAAPLYRDWVQQYEVREKLYRLHATAAHPFTFQHLFEHCRDGYPFYVAHGLFASYAEYEVFMLRDGGNSFKPNPNSGGSPQIHLPFRTVSIGSFQVPA